MSDTEGSIKGILIVQLFLILVTLLSTAGQWYTTKVANQNELETQLILNAYSLPDSLQQVSRLKTFCDLDFFKGDRRDSILSKISKGDIYVSPLFGGGKSIGHGADASYETQYSDYTSEDFLKKIGSVFVCHTNPNATGQRIRYMYTPVFHLYIDCQSLKKCEGETIKSEANVFAHRNSYLPCGLCVTRFEADTAYFAKKK